MIVILMSHSLTFYTLNSWSRSTGSKEQALSILAQLYIPGQVLSIPAQPLTKATNAPARLP